VIKGTGAFNIAYGRWLYGTPRWVLAQTRQEECDRLETTVMRPSGTRENKQTNSFSEKQTNKLQHYADFMHVVMQYFM
jgi:hypothetical protein